MLKTRALIQTAYDAAIECAENHKCCTVEETIYQNYLLQIQITKDLIAENWTHIEELKWQRTLIQEECPEADYQSILDLYEGIELAPVILY